MFQQVASREIPEILRHAARVAGGTPQGPFAAGESDLCPEASVLAPDLRKGDELLARLAGRRRRLCRRLPGEHRHHDGDQQTNENRVHGGLASITASATFGHSASPDNVTWWHIMARQGAMQVYVKYLDNFCHHNPLYFHHL